MNRINVYPICHMNSFGMRASSWIFKTMCELFVAVDIHSPSSTLTLFFPIKYTCEHREKVEGYIIGAILDTYHVNSFNKKKFRPPPLKRNQRSLQPGDAFEDTAFKPGFEVVKLHIRLWSLSSSLLCEIDTAKARGANGFLTSSSSRQVLFSASYSRID